MHKSFDLFLDLFVLLGGDLEDVLQDFEGHPGDIHWRCEHLDQHILNILYIELLLGYLLTILMPLQIQLLLMLNHPKITINHLLPLPLLSQPRNLLLPHPHLLLHPLNLLPQRHLPLHRIQPPLPFPLQIPHHTRNKLSDGLAQLVDALLEEDDFLDLAGRLFELLKAEELLDGFGGLFAGLEGGLADDVRELLDV